MMAPPSAVGRLNWSDAAAVKAWALDVCTSARAACAVGEDAVASPGERQLGRRQARRIIREASRKLADALAFAGVDTEERGLTVGEGPAA